MYVIDTVSHEALVRIPTMTRGGFMLDSSAPRSRRSGTVTRAHARIRAGDDLITELGAGLMGL